MANSGQVVLFVDDDAYFSRRYREALRESFDLIYCETHGDARDQLVRRHESGRSFDALVVDVMMPPPEDVEPHETAGGHETGLYLLVGVRDMAGAIPPTVLLTNRRLSDVRDGLEKRKFDPVDPKIQLCYKADTPARELPQIVAELIARNA